MDRIDVFSAARSGAAWRGRLALSAMPRLCASLTDGPGDRDVLLNFECRGLTDAQGRPALELQLDATLPLRCDRCSSKLALALDAQRTFYFVNTQAELAAIPIDDTPEEALLGSSHFDLAGLIEDEVILQLPISPRHADCIPIAGNATVLQGSGAVPADAHEPPHPFAGLAALHEQLQAPEPSVAKAPSGKTKPQNGAISVKTPRKSRFRDS